MRGQTREASIESLVAVSRILGAHLNRLDNVADALARREQELWERMIEPVVVAWDGKVPRVRIRLRAEVNQPIRGNLIIEGRNPQSVEIRTTKLPIHISHKIGKTHYVERQWNLGKQLPYGYHRLELQFGKKQHTTLIVSAPTKAHFPLKRKQWGIFAPLYSLRSERHPDAGTLTEFESLMDWMLRHGGRVGATLPLLSAFLDKPFDPSPYSPASRLFWNEFYVDVGTSSRPNHSDLVDYRREMQFRRSALEKQARFFFKAKGPEFSSFRQFVQKNAELTQYARFRAVTEKQASGWTGWPSRLRDGDIRRSDYNRDAEAYHLYAQWRVQSQLRSIADKATRNGQVLYLDLPLGLHPDSYDIWQYRNCFVREAAGGAPPDPVFTSGQNWGFPPMHPEASRLQHYEYTIAYIRNHLSYARLLRIDHVMGLHRLFWIPQGFTGDKGVYVSYPADELYAILSLESHRNKAGIVGENLGTVPPEVNSSMKRHNIQQMYVVQYELEGTDCWRALQSVPRSTVASLNTHDMSPFRAFLMGLDIKDRRALRLLDNAGAKNENARRSEMKRVLEKFLKTKRFMPRNDRPTSRETFKATMRFLASSMANIVLVNIDDLLGQTLPQNVPSTQNERPNWKRLTRQDLEEIETSSDTAETLRIIEEERR
jgi:4-alpha-glucanotransferase